MEALVASNQNQNRPMDYWSQRRSVNRSPIGSSHGGALVGHVPLPYHLPFSFPPPGNPVSGHRELHRGQSEVMNPRQPPLLPLPVSRPYGSVPSRSSNSYRAMKPKQKRRDDLKQPAKPSGPDPSDFKFSGFVFSLSPPPSSLPLPRFLPRQKLSCKAEVDTGATDGLRQMLRLL